MNLLCLIESVIIALYAKPANILVFVKIWFKVRYAYA